MKDTYKTIKNACTCQFKEKGSRFIGFLFPISSEEEAKNHLYSIKKEHYSATHYCYAYTFGHIDNETTRVNDDAEPSGSAGRPIFGQLKSAELKDVLAVVVRYFGGSKLGIPRLINAYKSTTLATINKAEIIEKHILEIVRLSFNYEQMNMIMQVLKHENANIRNIDYTNKQCVVNFEIRQSLYPLLKEKINLIPFVNFEHLQTV